MRAVIDWKDGETSRCECEKRSHGSTRQLKLGMTAYMLKFERRWYRVHKYRGARPDHPTHFVNIGGVSHGVTFEEAKEKVHG